VQVGLPPSIASVFIPVAEMFRQGSRKARPTSRAPHLTMNPAGRAFGDHRAVRPLCDDDPGPTRPAPGPRGPADGPTGTTAQRGRLGNRRPWRHDPPRGPVSAGGGCREQPLAWFRSALLRTESPLLCDLPARGLGLPGRRCGTKKLDSP
jgi:hypothetical protein